MDFILSARLSCSRQERKGVVMPGLVWGYRRAAQHEAMVGVGGGESVGAVGGGELENADKARQEECCKDAKGRTATRRWQ